MVKYLGCGKFDVDGETMQYDFINECFPEGFEESVYREAFACPEFKRAMRRAASRYRANVRLGQEYAEDVLATTMW